jgi:uncharacterized protein with GYD domain
MTRHVVLLKFTEKGITHISDSPDRAADFRKKVEKAGGKVEAQYWTLGQYDGALVFTAPDETTAAALVLGLGKADSVSTCMLRALDAQEFKAVLAKLG